MSESPALSDQNLLFGILSLQLDFINREQLVTAMNAWVINKSQRLEAILCAQGALNEEERALLAALVSKHQERHGNDLERSLANLSSVASSLRDELGGLRDADIDASLMQAGAARTDAEDGSSTIAFGNYSSGGLRFRVLRPHAKGGLGEVFVAKDNEIPREVALKQIQERQADNPESRARFMLEAELTGGLEHPGIVPVYGLGTYSDGRPFYAMRLIRGSSLKQAIHHFHKTKSQSSPSERSLSLRKLLGRFIDVCDAVEYAHSRGVLHRDLKPGNIMLGKYGETLVVDWGLAKSIDRSSECNNPDESALAPSSASGSNPTLMGSAIGTPAYMSPEQASGRLDLLGGASDVYSLGATLYSVLTGLPPFSDDEDGDLLQRVQKGDFRPPLKVDPRVPAALDSICLKAMALAPEGRYASPRQLSEDIEHWLADEPVSAHKDPLLARGRRWARQHRTLVVTTIGVMMAAVVSLLIGAILLANANQRIRAAQQLAERNEVVARENFDLARKSVDDYLTAISQETLLDEPGMQPLREKLLREALRYYREFVRRRQGDPALNLELRDANLLVGSITQEIGLHEESIAAFRRALEINQKLLETHADDKELRLKLAQCQYALATAMSDMGQAEQALGFYQLAQRSLEEMLSQEPPNPIFIHELRSIYNAIAGVHEHRGDLDEAMRVYRLAVETEGSLRDVADPEGEYRNGEAQSLYNLASLDRRIGAHEQAIEYFSSSVKIREQLVDEFPRKQVFRAKLALGYTGLANELVEVGRIQEAIPMHRQAIAAREQLAQQNPAVTEYHSALASSYSNLASAYRLTNELGLSAELGSKAIDTWRRLAEQHQAIVEFRVSLGTSLYNQGNLALGNPAIDAASMDEAEWHANIEDAIENYIASIEVFEALLEGFPDIPEYQSALARSYNNCSSAYHVLKQKEKSFEMGWQAIEIREDLVAKHPDVPDYRNELASSYTNTAGDASDPVKLFELLNKSVDLRQSLVDNFPEVPAYRYELAFSLQNLALRQFVGGLQAESLPTFTRVIALLEALHAEFPDVPKHRQMLVQSLQLLAAGQRLSNELEQATETEQKIVSVYEKLLVNDPENIEFTLGLLRGITGVGKCLHKGKEYESALAKYSQAVELLAEAMGREPDNRQLSAELSTILEYRVEVYERLGLTKEAINDLSAIIERAPSSVDSRIQRGRLRTIIGEHVDGVAEIAELLKDPSPRSEIEFYNGACVYSLAAAAARDDQALSQEEQQALAAEYVEKVVECLQNAQERGYFASAKELEHLTSDTDFTAVQSEPAFLKFRQTLAAALEARTEPQEEK